MRNQKLDVLRGIAILLVLGSHYDYFRLWDQIGYTGVDLFFVLSGFLISGLLFDEYAKYGNINIVRFWIRRGFKIYPSFYLLVLFTLAGLVAAHNYAWNRLLLEVTFLQSYFPRYQLWGHTWSLSVEEHFYLALPLLLVLLIKVSPLKSNPFRFIPWIFGLLVISCISFRFIGFIHGVDQFALHTESYLRADSLFAGVFLRYLYHFHADKFKIIASKPIWIASVLLVLPSALLPLSGEFMTTLGLSMLWMGFGCLLVWSVDRPTSRNPIIRSTAWIGKYSYSIYLWHVPLRAVLYRHGNGLGYFILDVSISIAFGVVMAKLIEIPSLKIRDRLFPQYGKRPVTISKVELVTLKKEIA